MSHKHLHVRRKLFTDQSVLPCQFLSALRIHSPFQHIVLISTSARSRALVNHRIRTYIPLHIYNFWSDPAIDFRQESSRSSRSRRKRVKLEGICRLWTEEIASKLGINSTVKNSETRHRQLEQSCESRGFRVLRHWNEASKAPFIGRKNKINNSLKFKFSI